MTVTTTYRKDYLGRWLANARPGTTADPTDFVGRKVITGDKDFLGRPLTLANPSAWDTGQTITAGDYRIAKTGTDYDAVFVALDDGTTDGSTEPTWPDVLYGTVVDNAGPNSVTWQLVYDVAE